MLFELPNPSVLYQAFIDRDDQFEGRAFVGVSTTGIFCRLTCPARKPKFEHCRFFESAAECLKAGFRPCKRCHPLRPVAESEPIVKRLIDALEQNPQRRWTEGSIVQLGLDPSTVRRAFKRHFSMTFLEMARLQRLGRGFTALAQGQPVVQAQLDAGYASPDAFRSAFAGLLGQSPGKLPPNARLRANWIKTPLGPMIAVCDEESLHLLEFADRKALPTELKKLQRKTGGDLGVGQFPLHQQVTEQLTAYFSGTRASFDLPLTLHGSTFAQTVWAELQRIPAGETRSYGQLAATLGRPTASRAVASANGQNQIALVIPCHRVIGADGSLTGYGGGLWRKQKLIEIEHGYRLAKQLD